MMLTLLHCVLLSMSVLILPHQANVRADGECTQDIRSGFRLIKIDAPARQIGMPITGIDAAECYSRCCDKRNTEGCNTATMFKYQGQMVCLLVQCQPLASCKWGKGPLGDESIAALISPRLDWSGVIAEAPTTQATVNTTEAEPETSTRHNITQVAVTMTPNVTTDVNADIVVENSTAEAQPTTAKPFAPIAGQGFARPVTGAVPVDTNAKPTGYPGLFAGGVANVPQSTAAPTAAKEESNDDSWGWLWNWGSKEEGGVTGTPEVTSPPAAATMAPNLNTGSIVAGNPAWLPSGGVASVPASNVDTAHNPIGAKQNPESPFNSFGAAASNPADIPVYDGFGNPIPTTPKAVTSQPPVAAAGGGGWSSWWSSMDTETEAPFGETTNSDSNEDDWDAWLDEQKQQDKLEDINAWGEKVEDEEDKIDNFGDSITDDINTFTPGLSNLDNSQFPSVQESGRKLVSSDAHEHPMTGSSFLDNKFMAVHNANRPVIVAGLCSLVVMVVLVMFFMARKTCQEKDRSRYRPLREESFSEIAYHDHPSP